MIARRDPASFRDEAGHVYDIDGRIVRSIRAGAAEDYVFLRDSGLISSLVERGWLIESREVPVETLQEQGAVFACEHLRLPFISYPYEWSFGGLQAAALLTLDIHLEALAHGATLVDASAFNVQFIGARPIFIDLLSLRRYQDGDYWRAQSQFCDHFLNPLLLQAALGVSHAAWFRGTLDGIPTQAMMALLPWRWKLRWTVLSNLVLPGYFQRRVGRLDSGFETAHIKRGNLPREALMAMLRQLRNFIAGLRPHATATLWHDYECRHSYADLEQTRRDGLVKDFAARLRPETLWDIGCNTGRFSVQALEGGARRVIGFDVDVDTVNIAFSRAAATKLDFLPLLLDVSNPTPDQGWLQTERRGLSQRRNADAILALAVLHHMVIGRNIPFGEAIDWLVSLAPAGLIEFVPRTDPMVQRMLALRVGASFADYDETNFIRHLERNARIVAVHDTSAAGRRLFEYARD